MTTPHGTFALAGYEFGDGHQVYPSAVTRGGIEWRTQDVENPLADGIFFGRDLRTPKPWVLTITVAGDTPAHAAKLAAEFAAAWEHARRQWKPAQEVTLDFTQHGNHYRLYGRPRTLDMDDNDAWVLETLTDIKAAFQPSHIGLYAGHPNTVTVGLRAAAAGGLIFPVVFPWSTRTGAKRSGIVETPGGLIPTDAVTITITGPVNKPTVTGPGWQIGLNTALAHDHVVTIDARARTVLRNDGVSLAGKLTRTSRLDEITMPTTHCEITYAGTDPAGISTATVQWHPITSM
ncbi:hypothetical protein [Brevibacterium luteolum]|uniref:Uncharacterized protein n=1 Tax=Brevibacterium luteolum TaxID=199591 RepID=A0A2N6PIJ4_9MICO|nr:hypothetical protein [Brevibacterium luteolum]MBM7530449.1 hypothetical protein [Brevibacterium luteolum]NNG77845.1 hypothetical protein [Brevibacterium luteolum]PMB98509.1 hypothetical protein CJ198_03985 [Brevibacterium luteolum]